MNRPTRAFLLMMVILMVIWGGGLWLASTDWYARVLQTAPSMAGAVLAEEELPSGISKFQDGNVVCYTLWRAGISCMRIE